MGKSVLVIEQEVDVGGACVSNGTIPSKTLRETAYALAGFRARTGDMFPVVIDAETQIQSLMKRKEQVIRAHQMNMSRQLGLAGASRLHGRARLTGDHSAEVMRVCGQSLKVHFDHLVIASGSRPRNPSDIDVDHVNIVDSESILGLIYMPKSLSVLGAGVIAMEYATVFAHLGCEVTVIDRNDRPLGFMDPELTDRLLDEFTSYGGTFIGGAQYQSVQWNGIDAVDIELQDGRKLSTEKCLFALGRTASTAGIGLEQAGVELSKRGTVIVDEHFRSSAAHIFAVGDVIGPPAPPPPPWARGAVRSLQPSATG
jgi:NAD(P) transhydrogenase